MLLDTYNQPTSETCAVGRQLGGEYVSGHSWSEREPGCHGGIGQLLPARTARPRMRRVICTWPTLTITTIRQVARMAMWHAGGVGRGERCFKWNE